MRVAVTGASGFVGAQLLERLLARGDEPACLARSEALGRAWQARGVRVVRGSLEDAAALRTLVDGAERVFHVAGLVAARSEAEFLRANRDGAGALAGAAAAAGAGRLVHVSTLAVTGPSAPGRPADESGPPRPVSAYGRSKAAGEQAVRASGVPWVIVRPPAVYGPRDRQLLRVFRLARLGLAPLLGDGRQELSLVHVDDLAGALLAAAAAPGILGRVFHAGAPERVTQRELVAQVGAAVGRRVLVLPLPLPVARLALGLSGRCAALLGRATLLSAERAPELLAPAWTCSSAALEREAGWSARIPLSEGLASTARWYREAGWL